MTDLSIRIEGRAGRVTFTRPQALNALNEFITITVMALIIGIWRP